MKFFGLFSQLGVPIGTSSFKRADPFSSVLGNTAGNVLTSVASGLGNFLMGNTRRAQDALDYDLRNEKNAEYVRKVLPYYTSQQRELMGLQNSYNVASMAKSQEYNLETMARQAQINSWLSSVGRQAFQMRQSGLNPAAQAGGFSSSVSGSSPSPLGAGSPTVGLQELSAMSSAGSQFRGQTFDFASAMESQSRRRLNDIDADTRNVMNLANIAKVRAETRAAFKRGDLDSASYRRINSLLDKEMKKFDAEISNLGADVEYKKKAGEAAVETAAASTKSASAAERQAGVAEKQLEINQQNADTAAKDAETRRQELPIKAKQATAALVQANAAQSMVTIEADKASALIQEMRSHAHLYDEQARHEGKEADKLVHDLMYYEERLEVDLGLKRIETELKKNQNRIMQKEADYWELKQALDYIHKYLDTMADFMPKAVSSGLLGKTSRLEHTLSGDLGNGMETYKEVDEVWKPFWKQ